MPVKGIISTKIISPLSIDRDYNRVELSSLSTKIEVHIDKSCLGPSTSDPDFTLKNAKWILVEKVVFTKLLEEERKNNPSVRYGNNNILEKIKPHILSSFKGPKVILTLEDMSITPGNKYLLMPYSYYPEFRYRQQNVEIVYPPLCI